MSNTQWGRLGPSRRVIAWRLLEGRRVSLEEIINALYGNDPNGGPLDVDRVVYVHVCNIGKFFRSHGVKVHRAAYGFGWFLSDADLVRAREVLAAEMTRNHTWTPNGLKVGRSDDRLFQRQRLASNAAGRVVA